MDIQKRINRYVNKHAYGGGFRNIKHFLKLVKIAEEQGRDVVIMINSPGSCLSFEHDGLYKYSGSVKSNLPPVKFEQELEFNIKHNS